MSRLLWLALLGAAPAAAPLAGQERSLVIERFAATIRVDPDGGLDVTERITARFVGSWNGLYRTIPVEYRTPQGFNWTLGVELLAASDDHGQPLRTERGRERHYLKYRVWVPGAQDVTRTIVLRYRARNGLRFFEEHDELYWNVTGDEWDVPIEAATAAIELPPRAAGVRAIAFNGVYGSTAQDADVEIDGTRVRVTMPRRLEYHEGLTVVVGWNKGVVAEPTWAGRALGFVRSNWPLVIPLPVFLVMLATWRRRGRDPTRLPISVQYQPPEGLSPAEAGALIDGSVDMKDVTATLVDLAVKGQLRFEERDDRKLFGLIGGREYLLHRLKPRAEWTGLALHERRVLEGVFEGEENQIELSELENEFYRSLPGIRDAVWKRLLGHGFYRARPDSVQGLWVFLGLAFGALVAGGGAALAARLSLTPVPFIVAGILSAACIIGFGLVMPARTVPGARAQEKVLGFEEFLRRVEADHMERIVNHPELFDRFLPFAMAFGVERKWAKAFEGICTEPPRWYVGPSPGAFNVAVFSGRLAELSSRASTTLASSPRSSSGSGFSSGSSGGGGGGGGGGGF